MKHMVRSFSAPKPSLNRKKRARVAFARVVQRSRDYHFFDNMVDAHCVRDEGGFTVHWLVVAFHWVSIRVRVYIYIFFLKSMSTMLSKKR